MNIFILHKNVRRCAQMHCDKHVVKMILESTLMLYTACWFVWYEKALETGTVCDDLEIRKKNSPHKMKDVAPKNMIPQWLKSAPQNKSGKIGYRPTHYNHPCSVWVRESLSNYKWLCDLAWELCLEYQYRYNQGSKIHACAVHIGWLKENLPPLPDLGLTEFRQAMPDEYKVEGDAISAYRKYYLGEKKEFAVWTQRSKPLWFSLGTRKKKLTFK